MSYFGSCGSLDPHSSFTTFGVSLVTLMRVVTQDSWETVMYACRSEHDLAPLYFIAVAIVGGMVMTNLFMAVVVVSLRLH